MLKKKMLTDKSGTLHEEIMEQAARQMAEDIDAEIMRGSLKDSGYHEVVIPWTMTHEQSSAVDFWVLKNTKHEHWNRGLVWLFKNEADAMWFRMRWMST